MKISNIRDPVAQAVSNVNSSVFTFLSSYMGRRNLSSSGAKRRVYDFMLVWTVEVV